MARFVFDREITHDITIPLVEIWTIVGPAAHRSTSSSRQIIIPCNDFLRRKTYKKREKKNEKDCEKNKIEEDKEISAEISSNNFEFEQ